MNDFMNRHWVKINAAFYLFVLVAILLTASTYLNRAHMDAWNTADWLINYQGGFVRRGLIGEIIFRIGAFTHLDIVVMVTSLQVLTYLCILYFTFKLSKGIPASALNAFLVFSPAFMLFAVNDRAGSFKKEILLLALLSFHSYYLSRLRQNPSRSYFIFLSVAFVFIVMSHEMLLSYLPYFACGFYLQDSKLDRTHLFKYALMLVPATVVAGVIILFFKGDATVVANVCASLASQAPLDCQTGRVFENPADSIGAISFLAKSFSYGLLTVKIVNPSHSLMTNAVALVLAIAPILYLLRTHPLTKNYPYLLIFPLLALIASLPLLLVVGDYGRLIYIHAACLSYIALQFLNQHPEQARTQNAGSSTTAWILCLLFIVSWRLIHHHAVPSTEFVPFSLYRAYIG